MASARGAASSSLFLPWFTTSDNPNSMIDRPASDPATAPPPGRPSPLLDWLLLAACIAPFILAWIITRGHKLTWKPGEVTMIVGITAFVLILCNGIILGQAPSRQRRDLAEIGYFVAPARGRWAWRVAGYLRQAHLHGAPQAPGRAS